MTTPNRKKSYHSIVVPIALASAIVPIDVPKPPVFACKFPPLLFCRLEFSLSVVPEFFVLP